MREAIEMLAGPDIRLEQAGALTDLGVLLRRADGRVEARPLLRQVADADRHLTPPRWANAPTPSYALVGPSCAGCCSGLEALTASERRIAELAAEGLSNPRDRPNLVCHRRNHLTNVFNTPYGKTRSGFAAALLIPTQAVRA